MKTSHYVLLFGMLMVCMIPLCVYGVGSAEPNADNLKHNAQGILKSRAENKAIREDPNEQAKQTLMRKTQELQYTELLAVHRSYFTVFLQVLSIYLAIMGACLKIVSDGITKMKKKPEYASKTVLITLILFSFGVSWLFFAGLLYGLGDATERNRQIVRVAGILEIEHIRIQILEQVIWTMIVGTGLIIIAWVVMLVRGLMACAQQPTLRGFMRSVIKLTS